MDYYGHPSRPVIQQGNVGNNWQNPGPDPRNRDPRYRQYLMWLQQQRAQQVGSPRGQQRGGAQAMGPFDSPDGMSPTADAMEAQQRYAQASFNQYAEENTGVNGEFASDQARTIQPMDMGQQQEPIYNSNFHAPRRRVFARRGYNGALRPGDQMIVGENGPEQIQVNNPSDMKVTPFDPQTAAYIQSAANQPLQGEGNGSSGDWSVPENNGGFSAGRGSSGAWEAPPRTKRGGHPISVTDFQDKYLSGAHDIGGAATDEYNKIAAGQLAPYEAKSPAARRAGYELYAHGAHPIEDATVDQYSAAAEARRPGADKTLMEARKASETDDGYLDRLVKSGYTMAEAQMLLEKHGKTPAKASMTPEQADAARKAGGLPSVAEASAQKNLSREIIRQRQEDRRKAIEDFGTDRPMAVGAVHREEEARQDHYAVLQAQVAVAQSRAGAKGALTEADKAKLTQTAYDKAFAATGSVEAARRAAADAVSLVTPPAPVDPGTQVTGDLAKDWSATADAPSSVSWNGLWRRTFGYQADSEQEYEGKIAALESKVDALDTAPMSPAEKRRAAQEALATMPDGWLSEHAGKFGTRKRAIHQKLTRLATAQDDHGAPKRAGTK